MESTNLIQPQFCACANLRQVTRAITQFYDAILQPTGLRATQFTVLVTISLNGQLTMTELAQQLGMDRTTLTRNLKPLEKQGLVKSQAGEDKRTREVTITDQGKERVKKSLPLWERAQQQVVESLGAETFNQLLFNVSEIVSLVHQN